MAELVVSIQQGPTDKDQNLLFTDELLKLSDEKYDDFVRCLQQTGLHDLARILSVQTEDNDGENFFPIFHSSLSGT